jgi:peptide/nickel transport system substrate-binding protein
LSERALVRQGRSSAEEHLSARVWEITVKQRLPRRTIGLVLATSIVLTACGGGTEGDSAPDDADSAEASTDDEDGGETEGDTAPAAGGTLVFGASADPKTLDPALASDGESLRVSEQIYEGLVTFEPGTTDITGALAESWEPDEDGTAWTFQLREDVRFHDGEPFDAEAVCFNFDRWYNFEGPLQLSSASYYWQVIFGGFANNDPDLDLGDSLYASCDAVDETTATINLTRPSATFISGLSLTTFAIASPKALTEFEADAATVDGDGNLVYEGSFAFEHPIGTGPFKFAEWTRNDRLVLERNDDYWGEPAILDSVIFRPIADNAARLQALQSGEIDGYDLVEPQDVPVIEEDPGLQLLDRPAFNIGFIGLNQATEPFDDVEVRRAVMHGLNRQAVIDTIYTGRGEVATNLMPPSVLGWTDEVEQYDFDPELAKQILTDAGYELPVAIDFWYPTDVTRPYLPDPRRIFEAFVSDLEQSGFVVNPRSAPWTPDYLDQTLGGNASMYFMGQTGDFGDPDTFIGTFFRDARPMFGYENEELFGLLQDALIETDPDARIAMYEEANMILMEDLPALPFAHSRPALAFRSSIDGFVPSPVTLEDFSVVSKTE